MESRLPFIVDFGRSVPETSGCPGVSRYSVWCYDKYKMAHQVVDGGDDLSDLRERYGVSLPLVVLPLQ